MEDYNAPGPIDILIGTAAIRAAWDERTEKERRVTGPLPLQILTVMVVKRWE